MSDDPGSSSSTPLDLESLSLPPSRHEPSKPLDIPGIFIEKIHEVDPLLTIFRNLSPDRFYHTFQLADWRQNLSHDLRHGLPLRDFAAKHHHDPIMATRYFDTCAGAGQFMAGRLYLDVPPNSDLRVVAAGATDSTADGLAGQYLVVHSPALRNVSIYMILTEFLEDEVFPGAGPDETRGSWNWDIAQLYVFLNEDGMVESIKYPPHDQPDKCTGWLTRNAIGNILAHAPLRRELPVLFDVIRKFLVLPDEHGPDQAATERANYRPMNLGLLKRAAAGMPMSPEEVEQVLGTYKRKNLILRRLGIEPVARMAAAGKIEPLQYHTYLLQTITRDLFEDIRFIGRALKYVPEIVEETVRRISQFRIHQGDLPWHVEFLGKGSNKQVYHFQGGPIGHRAEFTLSTIREAGAFSGYSREHLDRTLRIWRGLSDRQYAEVPHLGVTRWFTDYHPSRLCEPLPVYGRGDSMGRMTGRSFFFYNNILVISREYIQGEDLRSLLASGAGDREKLAATLAALHTHFSLWKKTCRHRKGVQLGDPKPRNSVVARTPAGGFSARIVDLDCLRIGPVEQLLHSLDLYGYDKDLVSQVQAEVLEH